MPALLCLRRWRNVYDISFAVTHDVDLDSYAPGLASVSAKRSALRAF
jgi:hypothetical protein